LNKGQIKHTKLLPVGKLWEDVTVLESLSVKRKR